jgi:hypothetical protein
LFQQRASPRLLAPGSDPFPVESPRPVLDRLVSSDLGHVYYAAVRPVRPHPSRSSAPFVRIRLARFFTATLNTLAAGDESECKIFARLRRNMLEGIVRKVQRLFFGVGINVAINEHHAVGFVGRRVSRTFTHFVLMVADTWMREGVE